MKIRDGFAIINGNKEVITMDSGSLDIIADDGRTLYSINLTKEGHLEIDFGTICKFNGLLLDDRGCIIPRAANCFTVQRFEYKESKS